MAILARRLEGCPRLIDWDLHCDSSGTTSVALRLCLRRDALVASAVYRSMIHSNPAGMTSMPLRLCLRRDALVASAAPGWIIPPASAGTINVPLQAGMTSMPLRLGRDMRTPPSCVSPHLKNCRTQAASVTPRANRHPVSAKSLIFGGLGPLASEVFECMMTKTLCEYPLPHNKRSCISEGRKRGRRRSLVFA
jgi:hypothetical protein